MSYREHLITRHSQTEVVSLLWKIFTSEDKDKIGRLRGDDAKTFIDMADEV